MPHDTDVVDGSVAAGVAGSQQDRQRFPGAISAVVDEDTQRMETVAPLERRLGVLLVRMGRDQGGVHVDGERLLPGHAVVGGMTAGKLPGTGPSSGAGRVDGPQHPRRLTCQQADQPGNGRVGSHRAEHGRLGPQQRHVGQAVTAQRERDRQIGHDFARIMGRERFTPPRQRPRQTHREPGHYRRLGEQHAAGLADHPGSATVVAGLGIHSGSLHVESASLRLGDWDFAITFSQAGSTFAAQTTASDPPS